MLYGKKDNRPVLRREYFFNRISKASGVPKKYVRKVMTSLPEVLYVIMADCMRVQLCDGITLGGVMKDDDKRLTFNAVTREYVQSKTFIRPTCEFGKSVKDNIKDTYYRLQDEREQKRKEKEEKEEYDDD